MGLDWFWCRGQASPPAPPSSLSPSNWAFPKLLSPKWFSISQCICILVIPLVRSILVMNAKLIHHFKCPLTLSGEDHQHSYQRYREWTETTVWGWLFRLFRSEWWDKRQAEGSTPGGTFNLSLLLNSSVVVSLIYKTCVHSRHTTWYFWICRIRKPSPPST